MRHARQTWAGHDRIIVLQLDNAGWYGPENQPTREAGQTPPEANGRTHRELAGAPEGK